MKIETAKITEKSTLIIMNSGIENLTIQNLATDLNVDKKELYKIFSKDEDILIRLFNHFEVELREFVRENRKHDEDPAAEFKTFFKSLYSLFLAKPYYLSIIFNKRLKKRNHQINKSIVQMRDIIENYLTGLIDSGKKHNSFKTNINTKILVNKILIEFKQLMKDEQHINEMVLELELLRKSND